MDALDLSSMDMEEPMSVSMALAMSSVAGIATGLGALIVVALGRHPSGTTMGFVLSFAAGVMTCVSVFDLWLPAIAGSANRLFAFIWFTALAGVGAVIVAGLSKMLPDESSHASLLPTRMSKDHDTIAAIRLSLLMMITLTAHNLPEGIAMAVSSMKSANLGALMMIAIALHNIPEGFVIATPILAASGDWKRAILWSLLSGMSEPLGALLALLVLKPVFGMQPEHLDSVLCVVAGIMTGVSFQELVPHALHYLEGRPMQIVLGFISGAVVIGLTMLVV